MILKPKEGEEYKRKEEPVWKGGFERNEGRRIEQKRGKDKKVKLEVILNS